MSEINKQWLGLPLNLLWGYLAIAVFMTGDGFELAFLSHYIKSLASRLLKPLSPSRFTVSRRRSPRGSPAWWLKSSPRKKPC